MAISSPEIVRLVEDGGGEELVKLHRAGNGVITVLLGLLDDRSSRIRQAAARALAEIGRTDPESIEPLVVPRLRDQVMCDEDGEVIEAAAQAIGACNGILGYEGSLRVLKKVRFKPANRSPEDVKAAWETMRLVNDWETDQDGPSDASENLDDYIYGTHM